MARYGRQNPTAESILTTVVAAETTVTDVAAGNPATVEIEVPLEGYPYSIHTAVIHWLIGTRDAEVEGFEDSDVEVEITLGTGTVTKGEIVQNPNFPAIYYLPLTLSGEGTCTITIAVDVATYNGVDSPAQEVVKMFTFNVPSDNFPIVETTICVHEFEIEDHSWLNTALSHTGRPNAGGMFLGISDMLVHDDRVYAVAQIQKRGRETSGTRVVNNAGQEIGQGEISELEQAGAALFSAPTTGGSCTVHEAYPFITSAPRSPVVYNSSGSELPHYFRGSHYIYDGKGAPRVVGTLRQDLWEDEVGWIVEIGASVTQALLNWRSKLPDADENRYSGIHGGTCSPMRIYNGELYIYSGRSDLESVDEKPPTTETTEADFVYAATELTDWQLIRYSDKLSKRVDLLETNTRSGWQLLEQVALITNSVIGFNKGLFVFKPRNPTTATIKTDITDSSDVLEYENFNREFPDSGIIAIGSELIKYTAKTNTELTGLVRGSEQTTPLAHIRGDAILLVNHILDADALRQPISELSVKNDSSNLYNDIRLEYASGYDLPPIKKTNEQSIIANKLKVLENSVPLSFHQGKWAEFIAEDLIKSFGDLQYNLDLTLKPSPQLALTQVIAVKEPLKTGLFRLSHIVSISDEDSDPPITRIVARTLNNVLG